MSQSSPNFCTTETAWRDAMLVAHVSAADSWQMMLSESEDLGKKWVEHVMIPFDNIKLVRIDSFIRIDSFMCDLYVIRK
jgi:hypothetical protein